MSKFTNFRDALVLELGHKLIQVFVEAVVRRLDGGRTSGAQSPPSIVGDTDSVTGAATGSTREATGSTGSKDG